MIGRVGRAQEHGQSGQADCADQQEHAKSDARIRNTASMSEQTYWGGLVVSEPPFSEAPRGQRD